MTAALSGLSGERILLVLLVFDLQMCVDTLGEPTLHIWEWVGYGEIGVWEGGRNGGKVKAGFQ